MKKKRSKRTMALPGLRTLDRLVLREVAGPFVFGILIFTLIFVAGDLLFQAARLIIERGVPFGVVVRLFLYRLPEVVALTLPMSCLLSTLLGMTRLSANSELIALKSLGISFGRILRPVLTASFLVAAAALAFNETVVPFTSQAAETLMRYEILKNQSSALQEKVFLRDESGGELRRVIYLDRLDPAAGTMQGVMLHEFEGGRLVRTSLARQGIWKDGEWWIEGGQVFEVTEKGVVRLLFRFERQKLALNLSPEQLQRQTRRPADMSARELWDAIEETRAAGGGVLRLRVLFHLKLAVPWACVIMAVLGASFGASRQGRSGSSVGFGISVVLVFAYYVVMSLCRALGESGNMPPALAAWTPNAVFLAVGLFFSRRVN
ncbi:MAG: LPS export ABC transporter permease LptG [Synergistaceae bacterium]|jgi:lipopolysaccharide export system permease protein|nr:LPS export ABC transporter permease LptG [Synergistaceae bacterium]